VVPFSRRIVGEFSITIYTLTKRIAEINNIISVAIISVCQVCKDTESFEVFLSKKTPCLSFYRDAEGVFHFSDDEDAVKGTNAVQVSESSKNKVLIVMHISCINLQLVVIIA